MLKKSSRNQKYAWLLFIVYLILLTYFMFFAESFGRAPDRSSGYAYNLVLFKEIKRFYQYRELLGMKAYFLNIYGNIIGFMPFGFFVPIISKKGKSWYNTFLLSFLLSLCIETTQLIFKVGSFDVDDMLLNTIGGVLGFIFYQVVQMVRRSLRGKRKI